MEIRFCQYRRNFKLLPPAITEKVRTFCYPTYFQSTFYDPTDHVAARLVRLSKAFNESEALLPNYIATIAHFGEAGFCAPLSETTPAVVEGSDGA